MVLFFGMKILMVTKNRSRHLKFAVTTRNHRQISEPAQLLHKNKRVNFGDFSIVLISNLASTSIILNIFVV